MTKAFLPHSDGTGHSVVIGLDASGTKVAPLPPSESIRVAWVNGPGFIQLGGSSATAADPAQSLHLPTEAGVEVYRRGPDHSHIAWEGLDIHVTMGDGL
jgi:hypothetical protein